MTVPGVHPHSEALLTIITYSSHKRPGEAWRKGTRSQKHFGGKIHQNGALNINHYMIMNYAISPRHETFGKISHLSFSLKYSFEC